jgi:hypothetical protein
MTGCHARRKMSGYLLFALGTSLVYTIGGIRGKIGKSRDAIRAGRPSSLGSMASGDS